MARREGSNPRSLGDGAGAAKRRRSSWRGLARCYASVSVKEANRELEPGLGELLRHLGDLVDGGAQSVYRGRGLSYRPRYTPIMRCLGRGHSTVTEITSRIRITQGAVSQTIKLMESDGLVRRRASNDARSSELLLTKKGRRLLEELEQHWARTFQVIEELEAEIGHPLRGVLVDTIDALTVRGFAERLDEVAQRS